MKKIILREEAVERINDFMSLKLPKFIYKYVKNHNTSLGDNPAFPPDEDYSFDYIILKKRMKEVFDEFENLGLESDDVHFVSTELNKTIKECIELEKPIRSQLNKVCENVVNALLAVPEDTVNLTCELVDNVKFNSPLRIVPEDTNEASYEFSDLDEKDLSVKAIAKRRMINALIQGASYEYEKQYDLYLNDIYKLNRELPNLYHKIIVLNDYLLFTREEKLSDEHPMQGAYVEVRLGSNGNRTTINAQGMVFPLLLGETIRGFMELFSSHGLPSDKDKAKYILRKADFLLAEPWDLRLGVPLWEKLSKNIDDTRTIPFLFMHLCQLDYEEFNSLLREVFANTKKGNETIKTWVDEIKQETAYKEFIKNIQQKNVDTSLISDEYFTPEELDDSIITEEDDDNNNEEELFDLIRNCSWQDIDFEEGDIDSILPNMERLIVTINGTPIPTEYINLQVQATRNGGNQLHLFIADNLQRQGLGFKIYYSFLHIFGETYSGNGRRMNKEGIGKIYQKLAMMPDIDVHEVYSANGQPIALEAKLKQ